MAVVTDGPDSQLALRGLDGGMDEVVVHFVWTSWDHQFQQMMEFHPGLCLTTSWKFLILKTNSSTEFRCCCFAGFYLTSLARCCCNDTFTLNEWFIQLVKLKKKPSKTTLYILYIYVYIYKKKSVKRKGRFWSRSLFLPIQYCKSNWIILDKTKSMSRHNFRKKITIKPFNHLYK